MSDRPADALEQDEDSAETNRPEPGSAAGQAATPERPATSHIERRTDPGGLTPDQPDEGWRDGPAGHREGRSADDDLLRRKG